MVVLNQPGSDDSQRYDLSFMYSLRCNAACTFCMYDCGPDQHETLDLSRLFLWIKTIDLSRIASFGLYGGEVSLDLEAYSRILSLLPVDKPKFCLSNGVWSHSPEWTAQFLDWCEGYRLLLVVSSTEQHQRLQNRKALEALSEQGRLVLKDPEERLQPMGRLEGKFSVDCDQKCRWWSRALRLAVRPDGRLMYQNCNGVYPIVGSIQESFNQIDQRVQGLRRDGFGPVCPHW